MENSAKKSKAEHASGPPRSPGERTLGRKASVPSMRREPLAQRVIPNGRNHPALLTPPFLSPSPLLTQSPQARIAVSSDEINYFSTLPDSPPRDPPSPRIQIFSEDAEEPSSEIIGGAFRSSMLSRDLDAYVFPSPAAMTTGSSSNSPDAHSPPSFTPSLLLSPPLVVPEPQQPQTSVRSKRRPPAIIAPAYNLEVDGQLPPGTTIPTPTPSPRLRRFYPLDPSTSPLPSPNPEQGSFPFLACPSPSFLSAGLPSPALSMSGHSPSENGSVSPRLLIAEPFSRLAAGLTKRTRRNSNDSTQCDLPLARSPSPSPSSPQLSAPELTRRPSFTSSNSEKEQEKAREASKRSQKVKGKHLRGFSWIDRPDETMRVKVGRWIGGWRGRAVRLIVLAVLGYMIFSTPPAAPAPVNIRRRQIHSAHGRLRRGDLGRSFIHPDVVDPHHRRSSPISFARFVAAPYHFAQKLLALPTSSYKALAGSRSARDAATARSKKNKSPATVVVPPPRTAPVDHNPLPAPLVHADSANRDTLVLYRILGNDLPPRHSPGQTLRNLRFLLQYESDFSTLPHVGPHPIHHSHVYGSGSHSNELHSAEGGLRVDKYFVLNRIADQEMLDAIRGLLRLYSVPESRILVIPFEWEEYQKREFNWDGGVDKLSCWGVGSGPTEPPAAGPGSFAMGKNSLLDQGWKVVDIAAEDAGTFDSTVAALRAKKKATLASLRALDYMYHEKNLYAMNNVRPSSSLQLPRTDLVDCRTVEGTLRWSTDDRSRMLDGFSRSTATLSSLPPRWTRSSGRCRSREKDPPLLDTSSFRWLDFSPTSMFSPTTPSLSFRSTTTSREDPQRPTQSSTTRPKLHRSRPKNHKSDSDSTQPNRISPRCDTVDEASWSCSGDSGRSPTREDWIEGRTLGNRAIDDTSRNPLGDLSLASLDSPSTRPSISRRRTSPTSASSPGTSRAQSEVLPPSRKLAGCIDSSPETRTRRRSVPRPSLFVTRTESRGSSHSWSDWTRRLRGESEDVTKREDADSLPIDCGASITSRWSDCDRSTKLDSSVLSIKWMPSRPSRWTFTSTSRSSSTTPLASASPPLSAPPRTRVFSLSLDI